MDGGYHTLSRYLAEEAERLVCTVALMVALGASVVGCWIGSVCAGECSGCSATLAWHCRPAALAWYCLPAGWWLWLFVRARSPRERTVGWVAFGIAVWTAWLGVWMPHDMLGRTFGMMALLMGPILGALALFALILRRRALRSIWQSQSG